MISLFGALLKKIQAKQNNTFSRTVFTSSLLAGSLFFTNHLNAAQCSKPKAELESAFPSIVPIHGLTSMVQPKKDSSFWVATTREGEVLSFDNSPKAKTFKTVLDIRKKVDVRLEMGMTGAAFHPNYPQDKRLFIVYNDKRSNGRSTVSSIEVNPKTLKADPSSEEIILTLDQMGQNHNGGDVSFGPDNMLYLAFGDGGFDMATSQDKKNLYGSLLRINVDTTPYSIPKDNPFNQGQARCEKGKSSTTCPEIFAYGFRNPWRFSFDLKDGQLWLADVGEDTYEEIDRVKMGKNYGWPVMEGSICFENRPCNKTPLSIPVTEYGYEGPQSIIGGFVYRGNQSKALVGHYFFTDTFGTKFYSVPANAKDGVKPHFHFNSGRKVASLAQGNDGEIYLLNFEPEYGDVIHRIVGTCKS